jgi:sphingomyelin phosphodiesterase acid-like 3
VFEVEWSFYYSGPPDWAQDDPTSVWLATAIWTRRQVVLSVYWLSNVYFRLPSNASEGDWAMFSVCSRIVKLWLLLTLLVLTPNHVSAQAGSGQFLLISDIHFDPFYDGTLFDQLDAQPVEDWAGILEKSQPPGFCRMGTDTNYALLKSSLDEARRRMPAPDFILYPGDFLAHLWQTKYDALAKQSHLTAPQPYRAFTAKSIQFLANEFQRRYPNTPILTTLGNDDSYCGDYMITPHGPFLKMFAEAWAPLLGPDANRAAFHATFSQLGHYTLRVPRTKRLRLIVLNSIYCSVTYDNVCGTNTQTPALDQLRWLSSALEQAQAAGETVWLLTHIPPGLNGYSTATGVSQGNPAVTFWQPELTSRFLQLVRQYQATVQIAIVGHTHMDDFRVIRLDGKPVFVSKIAPAISPIYGNNPGFQVYQYDRETGTLQNYQTYYLTNLASDGKPTADGAGIWSLEYDFREAYGFPVLDSRTAMRLAERIGTDANVQQNYIKFYSVSAAPEINAQTIDAYRCVIFNVTPPEFQLCHRGVPEPIRPPPFAGRKILVEPNLQK